MQELTGISTVKTEEVEHHLWNKAFKIYNDTVQLLVLTEVGPRILFFGFVGEENEFHEIPEHSGKRGDQTFRVYGGHRLWVSPEIARTYYPDNLPVAVKRHDDAFVFTAPPESMPPGTGLQKEIEIKLAGHWSTGHGHTPHPKHWARAHRDGSMGTVSNGWWREGHSPASAARTDVVGQIITRRSPCSVVLHRFGRSTMEDRYEIYAASPDKQLCGYIQGADGRNL